MTQLRSNKAQVPTNADTWNPVGDLAILADSLEVIVPVADRTEADAVATARAAVGWPVSDARPLFVWNSTTKTLEVKDGAGWRGAGLRIRYQRFVSSYTISGGLVQWDVGPLVNQAGDQINGGFASQSAQPGFLVINETGWYSVHSVTMPNGNPGTSVLTFMRNNSNILYETGTNGTSWGMSVAVPRFFLSAGDTILWRLLYTTQRVASTEVWLHKLDN